MESFLNLKIVENSFELENILAENSQLKEKNTVLVASIEKNTVLVASIFLAGAIVLGILIYYKEQETKRKGLQL